MPWFAFGIIIIMISGCTHTTRDKALHFFFTGIPTPEQQAEQQRARTRFENIKSKKEIQKQNQLVILRMNHYLHGPYAAGWCNACHNSAGSTVFRGLREKKLDIFNTGLQTPQKRLAFPINKLCFSCHDDKKPEVAQKAGFWEHGPVANGLCIACHDPHKSQTRYMLKAKTTGELCTKCHVSKELHLAAASKPEKIDNCTQCHNPHIGRTSFLLKSDFDENKLPAGL